MLAQLRAAVIQSLQQIQQKPRPTDTDEGTET